MAKFGNSFLKHLNSLQLRAFFSIFSLLICAMMLPGPFYITSVYAEEVIGQQSSNELYIDITNADDPVISRDEEKQQDPTILRTRYVSIDFGYLMGKDYPNGRESITLSLFDDLKITGIKERLERRSSEKYTWFGRIEEAEIGQIIMVVENNVMAANITMDGKMFQIRAIGDGVHALREVDQTAFPDACDPVSPVPEENNDLLSTTASTSDLSIAEPVSAAETGPYIDVLVVYSDDAASATFNINSQIQLAIDETNQTYSNSGINQRLRLVHTQEMIYAETGDLEADLNCITNVDGCLDEVHQIRDDYGADVASLWVENGYYCGIAWLMQMVSHYFEKNAFSVVKRNCATGFYVFGHELGHNMGAHHDRANASEQGAYPYSYGYQDPQENWHTVMAYNCPSGCPRVPYWSNPDVLYNGEPMGVPAGEPDSADNHKTLNNTAITVTGFRPCRDDDDDGFPHYEYCGPPMDCNDSDYTIFPGAQELCDGIDNDCDGSVDEDLPVVEITPPLQPGSAKQGTSDLDVIISGSGFTNEATCEFCDQVTVNSCSYESASEMKANISIDILAELGFCEVSVINPICGSTTCTDDCFEVTFNCQNADMDEDGRIDGLDLAFLARAFGLDDTIDPDPWWHKADLDGSGMVDGNDLALLAVYFGEDSSTCD